MLCNLQICSTEGIGGWTSAIHHFLASLFVCLSEDIGATKESSGVSEVSSLEEPDLKPRDRGDARACWDRLDKAMHTRTRTHTSTTSFILSIAYISVKA